MCARDGRAEGSSATIARVRCSSVVSITARYLLARVTRPTCSGRATAAANTYLKIYNLEYYNTTILRSESYDTNSSLNFYRCFLSATKRARPVGFRHFTHTHRTVREMSSILMIRSRPARAPGSARRTRGRAPRLRHVIDPSPKNQKNTQSKNPTDIRRSTLSRIGPIRRRKRENRPRTFDPLQNESIAGILLTKLLYYIIRSI